jgi:membrane-associated phospholipid phosphatase
VAGGRRRYFQVTGALETPAASEAAEGLQEPRRPVEWVAAALLLAFVCVLALVRFRWARGVAADAATVKRAHEFALAHRWTIRLAMRASLLGSPPVLIALTASNAILLLRRRRSYAAVFVIAVASLGAGLSTVLKVLLARPRPFLHDRLALASGTSFPSGHAMNATICYLLVINTLLFSGLVSHRRRRYAWSAVLGLLPVLIGSSRVALNVHYVSDVLGGWTLGAGWMALATALLRPWGRDPSTM